MRNSNQLIEHFPSKTKRHERENPGMLGRYVLVGGVRNRKESSITSEQAAILAITFSSVGHFHPAMQDFNRVVFEYHDVLISDSFVRT